MSMRQLVEGDCGGVNPLMQIGGQFTKDLAYKEEGFSGALPPFQQQTAGQNDELVKEFLGQIAAPPQSFQMNNLLQEMREIESRNFHPQVVSGPRVIDQVSNDQWAQEYSQMGAVGGNIQESQMNSAWKHQTSIPGPSGQLQSVNDFFNQHETYNPNNFMAQQQYSHLPQANLAICPPFIPQSNTFANQMVAPQNSTENWFSDFEKSKMEEAEKTESYNEKFWEKLQNDWQKIVEESDNDHPWLSEFSDLYDPYKEYTFQEDNVMSNVENALERGKEFLTKGDLPSAVLCFEVAAKQDPENAEIWELLGITQAENEMDPLAIAALKKSLDLLPGNLKVLMALAVSYTNESLQSQALKMMSLWLQNHPKYKNMVDPNILPNTDEALASSLIRGPELKQIQNMFLDVVQRSPNEIDADIQEALGVLFNLSSEYNKAVDCFEAALHVKPDNAKLWNRLGASLANGNRSVEAVEAYQRALEIEPGFIRVRYNVGICCMNLKAYKEAAEHLLTALNLQATSSHRSGIEVSDDKSHQMSDTIWSTFKMIISLMGRNDLQQFVNTRNLDSLNKALANSE